MKIRKASLLLIFVLIAALFFYLHAQTPVERIVIYGDTRTNHAAHQKIIQAITKIKPQVVFHLGDFVTDSPNDWLMFKQITAELRKSVKFYPVVGNHEYKVGIESFFANFALPNNKPWYSVELQGIHFIILDSKGTFTTDSEQYQWLKNDLKNIGKEIKFTIVLFHHAPFNSRRPDEMNLRYTLVPILEKYKVDSVFNGHVHAYERLRHNHIYYIITGGGGAPIHEQMRKSPDSQKYIAAHHFCLLTSRGKQLSVKVFNNKLKVIDKFTLKAKKSQ